MFLKEFSNAGIFLRFCLTLRGADGQEVSTGGNGGAGYGI